MFGLLLGSLTSLLGTAMNGMFASSANSYQASTNEKLMRLQDELQGNRWQQQFDTTNQYNDPSAQLKRMQDAGINPLFDSGAGAGNSQATPSPSVSGASVSPAVPQADLSSIVSAMLQEKSLQLEDRKVKAMEKKTDSDISNNTNMTNSEIQVNGAKFKLLVEQKDKTSEEIEKIKVDRKALEASIQQRWEELKQSFERNQQGWLNSFISGATSAWQRDIAYRNNKLGWFDAGTRRQQVNVEKEKLEFEKNKWKDQYSLEVSKFNNMLRVGNIEAFMKVLDSATYNINGVKMISPNDIQQISAMLASFVNSATYLSDDKFATLCPKVASVMESFMSKSLLLKEKPKAYNYYSPKDVSDGW